MFGFGMIINLKQNFHYWLFLHWMSLYRWLFLIILPLWSCVHDDVSNRLYLWYNSIYKDVYMMMFQINYIYDIIQVGPNFYSYVTLPF